MCVCAFLCGCACARAHAFEGAWKGWVEGLAGRAGWKAWVEGLAGRPGARGGGGRRVCVRARQLTRAGAPRPQRPLTQSRGAGPAGTRCGARTRPARRPGGGGPETRPPRSPSGPGRPRGPRPGRGAGSPPPEKRAVGGGVGEHERKRGGCPREEKLTRTKQRREKNTGRGVENGVKEGLYMSIRRPTTLPAPPPPHTTTPYPPQPRCTRASEPLRSMARSPT